MEAKAGLLERHADIVEKPAHLAFGVAHQPLVEDAVHAPRQDVVNVRHQPDVIGVKTPEPAQVISDLLSPREMLPEIGDSARQRVPAHVDDLRVRKDEVDERHMQPVVRHLVDEERPRLATMNSHQLEIFLAIGVPLIRAKRRQPGVIVVAPPSDLTSDETDVGELLGAFDCRMAGEDLFDQRRARPGHADDEDGVGRERSAGCPFSEERLGERSG